ALAALVADGAGEILLNNRSQERARAVSRRIGGPKVRVVPIARELEGEDFDLVVNATRLGLAPGDPSPVDFRKLNRAGAAMDLVYGRHTTGFVQAAEAAGIRATDGMDMLIQQGAVSFERWWGHVAPVEAMREAVAERQTG
ncbi:MAG: hypothetical protein P8L45_09175, partial [Longimicrobiales bacterium]|nr:hypothetical protein [Longimicrobiales bacterium]